MKKILFGLALFGAPMGVARATPISITTFGSTYTQNFDGLAGGFTFPTATGTGTSSDPYLRVSGGSTPATLQGFEFAESGNPSSNLDGSFGNDTGVLTTGDSYRYRTTGTASDVAFGQLNTPNFGNEIGTNAAAPGTSFGLVFRNDTTQTIDSLTISYRGEQYRYGGATGNTDRVDFQIKNNATTIIGSGFTDVDSLDFASLIQTGGARSLDGNLAANSTLISGLYSPTGGIAAGSTFTIRFTPTDKFNGATNVSDDGLAIDDFSLTANVAAVPEPSTLALFTIGLIGFAIVVRRRKAADQGTVALPC